MRKGGKIFKKCFKEAIQVETNGKGLYPITDQISKVLRSWSIQEGMWYLFIPHTSASLVINESYDPTPVGFKNLVRQKTGLKRWQNDHSWIQEWFLKTAK